MSGLSIANNLLSARALLNLSNNELALQKAGLQLASGERINSAADDPSGLAIADGLQARVGAFNRASENLQTVVHALNVASGAISNELEILQRIHSLAIDAASGLKSEADRVHLQAEISGLLLQINRISEDTQFYGTPLLDGRFSGVQPDTLASYRITDDGVLASAAPNGAGNLIAGVQEFSTTSSAAVDGTIEVQVFNTSSTSVAVQVSFFSSASAMTSGTATVYATAASGYSVVSVDGLNVSIGNVTLADAGVTAYVKVSQATAGYSSANGPIVVQAGENEGSVIGVPIIPTDARSLRLSNLNVADPSAPQLADQDAIGQIQNAIDAITTQRIYLDTLSYRLSENIGNDNLAAVNLQSSEAVIRDVNVAQAVTEFARLQVLVRVDTSVLAQANAGANGVVQLLVHNHF